LLSEFPDKGRKLGSIDTRQSAEENPHDGYNVQLPGSGRPRSAPSSGGPRAQSEGQAKKASISL